MGSGNAQVDELVQLLIVRTIQGCNESFDVCLTNVENDMTARNLRGGVVAGAKLKCYLAHLDRFANELAKGILELAAKANGGTIPKSAEAWIVATLDETIDGLTRGLVTRLQGDLEMRVVKGLQAELEQVASAKKADVRRRVIFDMGVALLGERGRPAQREGSGQNADADDMVPELMKKAAFERDLERLVSEAKQEGYPLALVMSDGDGFKRINDEHGHDVGDAVIKALGAAMAQRVRQRGTGYRFGGDEFSVLLPNHSAEEAAAWAEILRSQIEQATFTEKELKLTATFGVACLPDHASDRQSLLRAADQALRDAKSAGRNRVGVLALEAKALITDRQAQPAWEGIVVEHDGQTLFFDWGRRVFGRPEEEPMRVADELRDRIHEALWLREDVSPDNVSRGSAADYLYVTDERRAWRRKLQVWDGNLIAVQSPAQRPRPPKCPSCSKRRSVGAINCPDCGVPLENA